MSGIAHIDGNQTYRGTNQFTRQNISFEILTFRSLLSAFVTTYKTKDPKFHILLWYVVRGFALQRRPPFFVEVLPYLNRKFRLKPKNRISLIQAGFRLAN